MKWLLITTLGTNPGDEFVRLGVQKCIRAVDPDATFDLLNKENPEHYVPRDFDKCVWCGMPLFWSSDEAGECTDIYWWEPLMRGWPTARKKDFLVMGAGQVFVHQVRDFERYTGAIKEVIERVYAVTARQPIIDHPSIIDTVCPASFCFFDRRVGGTRRLCNFMAKTGHFPVDVGEVVPWEHKLPIVLSLLHEHRFEFVAHTPAEAEIGRGMGFPVYLFSTPEQYVDLYNDCRYYFGNRLHGAVAVAARGFHAWGVAYDSRLKMVERVGGIATRPSGVDIHTLGMWLSGNIAQPVPHYNVFQEFDRAVNLVREFAKQ